MSFISRERKGPVWTSLCIASLQRAIKRAQAAENPNVIYLKSMETMLQAYRDGKMDR